MIVLLWSRRTSRDSSENNLYVGQRPREKHLNSLGDPDILHIVVDGASKCTKLLLKPVDDN